MFELSGSFKNNQPNDIPNIGVKKAKLATPDAGYGVTINGSSVSGPVLELNTDFNGITTSINNTTYQLGINFVAGIASAEYNKKSGELIYIDNRTAIPRSSSQKEDIKIVLEF